MWENTYTSRIDGSNFETTRVEMADLFLQLVCSRKRVVTKINVVCEREGEFSVSEEACWDMFVV
jgi:hypothetical protein